MAANQGVITAVIEDKLRPDEDSNFKWRVTFNSELWRFLLIGNVHSVIKPSSFSGEIGSEDMCLAIFRFIEKDMGIQVLNTIERVHYKGVAVRYEALIYALAVCTCAEDAAVKSKAYELVNKICDESSHFLMFIDFRENICKVKRKTTGWSRSHRSAVQKWYQRENASEAAIAVTKCPRYNHWTHRDVLRLAHVIPDKESDEVLYSFLVVGLKKTMEKYKNESDKKADESQAVLKCLEQIKLVRSCQDVSKAVPIIKKLKLSWDFIPCQLHKDPELWKQLISYLPLSVLIPNVCRMAKLKLFEGETAEKVAFIKKCSDAKEVKDSKLHPYNILVYRELYSNAMGDVKRKVSWDIDRGILAGLNKALSLAFEYNLSPTGKRFFVTIDASNSMKAHVVNNNHMQCRTVAACMALCLAKVEKKVIIKAFSKELEEVKVDETTKIEDIVARLDKVPLGGTDCSRPLIFAKGKKIKTDVFIIFTDKESWSGKTAPCDALRQYRQTVKIPAKLIVVALNSDGSSMKRVSDSDDRGMLDILGFSPCVPKIISNFSAYNF